MDTTDAPASLDVVDRLLSAWREARPDLDASPLGVVGRVIVLAQLLEESVERALAKVFANQAFEIRMQHQAAVERARDALHRKIIVSRADSARGDHKIEIARAVRDFGRDQWKVIWDGGDT